MNLVAIGVEGVTFAGMIAVFWTALPNRKELRTKLREKNEEIEHLRVDLKELQGDLDCAECCRQTQLRAIEKAKKERNRLALRLFISPKKAEKLRRYYAPQ